MAQMVPIYGSAGARIAKMGCVAQDRTARLLLMATSETVVNAGLDLRNSLRPAEFGDQS